MATQLIDLAQQTRAAAQKLGTLSLAQRNDALAKVAQALAANQAKIVAANQADCEAAQRDGLRQPSMPV